MEAEHFNEIRVNAKKSPCPTRNKGKDTILLNKHEAVGYIFFQARYAIGAMTVVTVTTALSQRNATFSNKIAANLWEVSRCSFPFELSTRQTADLVYVLHLEFSADMHKELKAQSADKA